MSAEKSRRAGERKRGEKREGKKKEEHTAVLLMAVPPQDHEEFTELVSDHFLFVSLLLPVA